VKPIKGVHIDLIAQSKNGSGKTGAFSIGSMLRVDRNIPKTQVLTICHVRELCLQTADVY
jgi:superfamily II DNA/RNA helicase